MFPDSYTLKDLGREWLSYIRSCGCAWMGHPTGTKRNFGGWRHCIFYLMVCWLPIPPIIQAICRSSYKNTVLPTMQIPSLTAHFAVIRLNLFYESNGCSPIPSCMERMKQNLTLCYGFKYIGRCCQMSPPGFIILWTIRRLSYKTTVAPNIYITTCYEHMPKT